MKGFTERLSFILTFLFLTLMLSFFLTEKQLEIFLWLMLCSMCILNYEKFITTIQNWGVINE